MKKCNIPKIVIVLLLMIIAFITTLFGLYKIVYAGNLLGNIATGVFCIFGGICDVYLAEEIWES